MVFKGRNLISGQGQSSGTTDDKHLLYFLISQNRAKTKVTVCLQLCVCEPKQQRQHFDRKVQEKKKREVNFKPINLTALDDSTNTEHIKLNLRHK